MKYQYETVGTCSRLIEFDVEDGIIKDLQFIGGCNGNLKGISALVRGQRVTDVISRLKGIQCGAKGTSCPDQFATALQQIAE
jgi:uncharacterized protein (TIGR03905 family)